MRGVNNERKGETRCKRRGENVVHKFRLIDECRPIPNFRSAICMRELQVMNTACRCANREQGGEGLNTDSCVSFGSQSVRCVVFIL